MKLFFKLIITIILSLSLACSQNVDVEVGKMVIELNKSAPFFVDQYTRFDSSSFRMKQFYFNYTLISIKKSNLNLKEFEKEMLPKLKDFVHMNPSMKIIRKNKIDVIYKYYDSNEEFITTIVVSPEK